MNSMPQSTGILLVAAFAIFLVGAGFWLVREFERPLDVMLRAVEARRRRWMWIHAWMVAGTLVSVLAVASMFRLLRDDGGGLLSTIGFAAFVSGCLAFLVTLLFRLTATPRAAAATVATGTVPPAYQSKHRFTSALYVAHMLLSYAAFALFGGSMLGRSVFPASLGWTGVAIGLIGLVGFVVTRGGPFAPPIIAHSFGLLAGIVLLLRS